MATNINSSHTYIHKTNITYRNIATTTIDEHMYCLIKVKTVHGLIKVDGPQVIVHLGSPEQQAETSTRFLTLTYQMHHLSFPKCSQCS